MSGSSGITRAVGLLARREPRRWIREAAPAAGAALLLVALIPLSAISTVGAGFALAVATLLVMLCSIGLERSAIVLLCLGFVLAPLNDLRPVAVLSFVTASDFCLIVGFMVLAPTLVARPFRPPALFVVGVLGVVGMGLISSVANPDTLTSLNAMVRLVVGALVLPIVFTLWQPSRKVVVGLAASYVLGNVVNVIAALLNGVSSYENRYLGLTTHPNILGFCAMLGLALTPFLLKEISSQYRWLVAASAAICAYGIWISGSRAALLVAVAVAVLYPVLARSIGAALALFGLSILPIYFVVSALGSGDPGNNIIGRLAGGGSATASDQAREELVTTATDKFLSHPIFGNGFAQALEAHNIYLQIAAAGGVVVLVFYLLVIASVIRQPLQLGKSSQLLALPAIAYALIGPLTPLLWDRYIWCVLALPFLLPAVKKPASADTSIDRSQPEIILNESRLPHALRVDVTSTNANR